MIGIFGLTPPLVFGASPLGLLTFSDFEKTCRARYIEHEVHLQRPIVEFVGPELKQIRFKMNFLAPFTTPPDLGILALETMLELAQPQPLIIGALPVASGLSQFVLREMRVSVKWWGAQGAMIGASCDVDLLEYSSLSIGGFSI